jgi:hypothetical protein
VGIWTDHGGGRIDWIALTFSCRKGHPMDIEDEIKARILAAKVWDKDARLEDFQIKAADNGFVLINLKTRRVQLIYDEFSELSDLDQLFPKGKQS